MKLHQREKSSPTLDAVLAFVYRKQDLLSRCGRYADNVIDGLINLKLLKKVQNTKGTFYFSTDKAKSFKAIDFAKEFLWANHNSSQRVTSGAKKMILCFDSEFKTGQDLVDIEKAIRKGYV